MTRYPAYGDLGPSALVRGYVERHELGSGRTGQARDAHVESESDRFRGITKGDDTEPRGRRRLVPAIQDDLALWSWIETGTGGGNHRRHRDGHDEPITHECSLWRTRRRTKRPRLDDPVHLPGGTP